MGFFLRLVAVPRSTLRLRHTRPSSVYARRYCELARESLAITLLSPPRHQAGEGRGELLPLPARNFWPFLAFRILQKCPTCARETAPPSRVALRHGAVTLNGPRHAACACVKRRY